MVLAHPARRRCSHHSSFRPQLEHLEDRSVPATFNVTTTLDVVDPADGKRSLREAITKANTAAGADTIIVPPGVFRITIPGAGEEGNATGDFDIHDGVTISGAGAGLTVIDGQQLDRVFDAFGSGPSSIRAVFAGLTVRNGSANNGGGIQVGNADLVIRDCGVTGNRASVSGGGVSNGDVAGTGNATLIRTTVARNTGSVGGGLFVVGSSVLTVKDSVVRRNIAGTGGGIDTTKVVLTNSTVSGNEARVGTGGGGIKAATATLTKCTVSGNSSSSTGGGIEAATATLTNCIVSGNFSADVGGGMSVSTATLTDSTVNGNHADSLGGGISTANATLINCTVSGNVAGSDGGGIKAGVSATLTNCTVSGNSASGSGGGIDAASAILLNDTIAENTAHTGGGLFHGGAGSFNIRNTIIALNLVDSIGTNPDVSGTFASQGHNLIGDGTGGTGLTNGVNGNIVGDSINPIDPKLGQLQNNGGPTKTMALLAGSKAIDHGDNTILPQTDQRGFPRIKDGNFDGIAVVDIGAFER
jgi:hypothetical protein